MNSQPPLFDIADQNQFRSFTMRDLVSIIFKHYRIIFLTFILVTLVVVLGLFRLPSTYTFEAKILIKTDRQATPSFFSGVAAMRDEPDMNPVNRTIETEMELIESRFISEEVVDQLGLEWDDIYQKPAAFYFDYFLKIYNDLALFSGMPDFDTTKTKQDMVSGLIDSFTIAPTKSKSAETNSNIIQVTLKSPNRNIGVNTLNLLLKIYQDYDIRLNREAGERAYAIVENKLLETEKKVQAAQRELADFLASNKTTRFPTTMRLPVKPVGADSESDNAGAGASAPPDTPTGVESRWASNSILTTPQDVNSISLMKARLIEMELQLIELTKKYPGTDTRIVALRESISEIRERLNKELIENAENESEMITLERNLEAPTMVFKELKKRLTEISLFIEANDNSISSRLIVEKPVIPRSSEWKRKVIAGVIGSLGGLALGLFFAGFREYNDHTLGSKEDVLNHTGLQVLVAYPILDKKMLELVVDPQEVVTGIPENANGKVGSS